jgi:hypothetical protein
MQTSRSLNNLVQTHPHAIISPLATKTYPTSALAVLELCRPSSIHLFAIELQHKLLSEPYGLPLATPQLKPFPSYTGFPELRTLHRFHSQIMELTSFVRQGCNHLRSPTILTPEETRKVHVALYELYRLLPTSVLYFSSENLFAIRDEDSDGVILTESEATEHERPRFMKLLPESSSGFTVNYAPALNLDLHVLFTIVGIYTRLQQLRNDWGVLGQLCGKLQHFLSERCLGFDGPMTMTPAQKRIRTGEIMGLARGCVLREFGEGVDGVCREVEGRERLLSGIEAGLGAGLSAGMTGSVGVSSMVWGGFVEVDVEGYGKILVRRSCVRVVE